MSWVLAVTAGALSCDNPLAPVDVAGTYVYAPPGGLARRLSIDGALQNYTLFIYDTLTLQADGYGLLSGRSTWAVTPPGERDEITRTESFAFTIDGFDIETHPAPCPPARTCSGLGLTERFRFRDDAIVLLERAGTIDQQLYRRISPRAP